MNLDARAVIRGSGAYLAIAIPCGLIIGLLGPDDQSFLWVLAAVVVLLVAPVVGGAVAASSQPHAPLTQGAAAIGIPAGLFLVIVTIVRGPSAVRVVTFLLYWCVFIGLGMAGGYLSFRRHARSS
jgi:hypothetical protein